VPIPQTRSPQESRQLLQGWLERRLEDALHVEITELSTPRTGYSGETLLFEARWADRRGSRRERLVARIRPSGYSFFPDVDLELHFRVLRALEGTGVPAPRVHWYQDAEDSPFGEPFFVLDRIDGRVPSEYPPYTVGGWIAESSPSDQRRIYHGALDEMARIHRLDWRAMDLGFLPALAGGSPGMATEIRLFEQYLDWVLDGRDEPLLDQALAWLKANVPPDRELCLNWGDPKLSNIIYQGARPVGLLDWELATIAPPEADLAFWLVYHDLITGAQGYPSLPGFLSDEEAVAYYEARAGRPVRDLDWHRTWQTFRLAVLSSRLTDLLIARDVIGPGAANAPHVTPMQLLRRALEA
jgi:aminoglycoside phosphotransferase (APT) family kinase protein